jgi:acetylornithine deacetylase
MFMEALRIDGRAGHSSDPSLGANAMEGMHRVLGEMLRWRGELQQRFRDPQFTIPVATLNPGSIHGGDNPNRICGSCELQYDLRLLPGMDYAELRAELQQRLTTSLVDNDLSIHFRPLMDPIPALRTNPDSAIVKAAEKLSGHRAESVAFGTEAPFLNALGMDTIVLGPGDIDQAHQPDEYLLLNRLTPTVTLLKRLIDRFCVQPQAEKASSAQ